MDAVRYCWREDSRNLFFWWVAEADAVPPEDVLFPEKGPGGPSRQV